MSYSPDFDYAIGWNHFGLSVVGAWPQKNAGIFSKERSTFCALCIIVLIYLPQSASVFVHWGNMNAVIECLSVNGPVLLAFVKLLIFRYRRKEVRMVIDLMADDWRVSRKYEQRSVMLKVAKISRTISIGSGAVTNTLFVAYIFYEIYLGLEMRKRTDLDPRLAVGLLHPAWLPFDTKQMKFFIPMWIGQFFSTFFSMTIYAVFDTMVSAMILHICGQLTIVGIMFKELVNDETVDDSKLFKKKLAAVVGRHEKLNEFVNTIENSFNSVLLPQMLICTLTFCFQGYNIVMSLIDPSAGKVSFLEMAFSVTYVCYTVLHLFVYCYVGDQLLVDSSFLGYSIYDSSWYNLPASKARSLLFVGYRALRPLKITAGRFCNFSRNVFIVVLKTSLGYLSMLLTVQRRIAN